MNNYISQYRVSKISNIQPTVLASNLN